MNRLRRSLRATLLGLVVNTVLVGGKLVAGILGHSHALVADAVESLADIFSSIVVWRGLVVASAPADEDHPYGHGKAEPLAAAMVSAMLLLAAIGISVTAVQSMFSGERAGPKAYTLLVLAVVVILKEGLFRFVKQEAVEVDSLAVHTDAWHHRSDAITSLAAATGIGISLIGGPDYHWADEGAALVAAGIIMFNGLKLLRPALNELMDTAPDARVVEAIRGAAAAVDGVRRIEKCIVRKTGPLYFVDMHAEVPPEMTVLDGHAIAHRIKDVVLAKFPNVRDVLVHIEPAKAMLK